MKWFKTLELVLIFITFGTAAGLATYTRSPDPRVWWIVPQVWALNHGLVSVQNFDWGYLKLRSGPAGITTLADLRHRGANDDIRIAAAYAIAEYQPASADMCGDGPCHAETSMRQFNPANNASKFRTDLKTGQTLPRDFIVDTAIGNQMGWCAKPKSPDCILRMQDFNGDGKDEIYLETTRYVPDTTSEDQMRLVTIYAKGDNGWEPIIPRVGLYNFDARTYPQRPFIVEPMAMDMVSFNNMAFHFIAYPDHTINTLTYPKNIKARAEQMRPLGRFINQIPVIFPIGARIPVGLDKAVSSGAVDFARIGKNKPLIVNDGFRNSTPAAQYTDPPKCKHPADCHAIVADLDHDGQNEVILIADPDPSSIHTPFEATLLKPKGPRWQVMANIELCKEYVGDPAIAKIAITPSKWGVIRLGENRYPVVPNPWCDRGLRSFTE